MSDQILKMIDQIDNQSLFAECDVMCSLANSYTKEMMILEATEPSDEKKSRFKKLVENVKKFLMKIGRMIQIMIQRVQHYRLKVRIKKMIKVVKKIYHDPVFDGNDQVVASTDIITEYGWMRKILTMMEETKLAASDGFDSKEYYTKLKKLAEVFKEASEGIVKQKPLNLNDPESIDDYASKAVPNNAILFKFEDFLKYWSRIEVFTSCILNQAASYNKMLNRIIKKIESMNDGSESDLPDTSKISELASSMIKFVSIFTKNMINTIDAYTTIYDSKDAPDQLVRNARRIKRLLMLKDVQTREFYSRFYEAERLMEEGLKKFNEAHGSELSMDEYKAMLDSIKDDTDESEEE